MLINQLCIGRVDKWILDFFDFMNQLYADCQSMPKVELLILAIISLGLLALLCLVSTLAFKIYFHKKHEKQTSAKKEKFQEYLSFVVTTHVQGNFMHDYNEYDPIYLDKTDLQDDKLRKLFLAELRSIHAMLEGKEKETLRDLYLGFGFAAEVQEKIFSRKWEQRIEAINEISDFNLNQFYPILVSCLNDKNKFVRKAAFLKYASLKTNPIDALNYVEGKLNGWEKQVILENLKKRTNDMVPLFQSFKEKYHTHADFLDELTELFNQQPKKLVVLDHVKSKKA